MEKTRANNAFAATIFLGALLLFLVQPLIGKYILPWFGGSPAVWTVCMLFFQTVLFLGYAYAHFVTRRLAPKSQAILHVGLLLLALIQLPIVPDDRWQPQDSGYPTWRILCLLGASVGLPFFLLSTTGPLMQAWLARTRPDPALYRLYALSNCASLLALLSYPFLVEPNLTIRIQAILWSWLFAGFCLGSAWCAWSMVGRAAVAPHGAGKSAGQRKPTVGMLCTWFVLAWIPSVMLLATTNEVCTDLAVIPFLWIIPLACYLFSFILCFDRLQWCQRTVWAVAWIASLCVLVPMLMISLEVTSRVPLGGQVLAYFFALFCCAMVCHGELARLKPQTEQLTAFYLALAGGGAAGGVFVACIAPTLFPTFVELDVAIVGCCIVLLIGFYRDQDSRFAAGKPRWVWGLFFAGVVFLSASLTHRFQLDVRGSQKIRRNFYGVLRIELITDPLQDSLLLKLKHGTTKHGIQYVGLDRVDWPTSYYGEASGLGIVMLAHHADRPRRIGVVGLGVGTVASYGRPGDEYRFYEINPDVIEFAMNDFRYLERTRADFKIVPGDARVRLASEPDGQFDVLILDAFSSDAIPLHLLTREAWATYLRHLRREGILAVHLSTQHVNLEPVVAGHAQHFKLALATVYSSANQEKMTDDTIWCLLSGDPQSLELQALRHANTPSEKTVVWTDDRNSLFEVLRPRTSP